MNELRKKTTDKNLSKRIKNLVRKWQEVVNEAGIDLNQPFKKVASAVNGKRPSSASSPSLSHFNGQVNNHVVEKFKEQNCLIKSSSPVLFTISTPSPALSDPSRSFQSTPVLQSNGPSSKSVSPIVNNSPVFASDTASRSIKSKLSVINGHSNKLPSTPSFSTCDNTKASTYLAGKKRKSELPVSEAVLDGVVNKKSKSSTNNHNGNNAKSEIKNKLETSPDDINNQSINTIVHFNENSNDSKSSQPQHKNGFLNGGSYDDKVFSCNSTGNLKCTISRSKAFQTPPDTPSSINSAQTPPTPSTKLKSSVIPHVPSPLTRSKTPVTSSISLKTSATPPIQSSLKLKLANTPPIPATMQTPQKPLKKSATSSTPLHEHFKPVVKHPKVETTAQILQKLHSNSNLPLSHSLEKIASNRIKREKSEDEEVSVVPASIKPRGGKRKSSKLVPPHSNPQEVARAKDERMQIFLHSSSLNEHEPDVVVAEETSKGKLSKVKSKNNNRVFNSNIDGPQEAAAEVKKKEDEMIKRKEEEEEEVDVSKLHPDSAEYRACLLKNPWAFLPPLLESVANGEEDENGGGGVKGGGEEEGSIEERLNKLSLEKWSGVNGLKDGNGEWKDWTSSYSVNVNGEYCHILPYVHL